MILQKRGDVASNVCRNFSFLIDELKRMPNIPVLDPSPTKEAPFGYYSQDDTQIAERVDDVDQFVKDIMEQSFEEQVDDELEPYTHVALNYIQKKMIKISGVFTSEQKATDQAKSVSEGMFDSYVAPFQKMFVLGPTENTKDVKTALSDFAKIYNERIDTMKRRIEGAKKETPEDPLALAVKEEEKVEEEKKVELNEEEEKILAKMRRAIKRGDRRLKVVNGQTYAILSYCDCGEDNFAFRVCSITDSLSKAEEKAKLLYNSCKSQKRFDYLVCEQFEWKPGPPIDFSISVKKTHTDNKSLGRLYDSTNFLQSDEYKQALKNVEEFHTKIKSEKKEKSDEIEKNGGEGEEDISIIDQVE
jgi:hypothetical protein